MPATLSDVAQYTLSRRNQHLDGPAADLDQDHSLEKKRSGMPRNADKAGYRPIDMSLKAIRDAIPAHYFERSLLWSSLWLLHDLILAACLFYGALHIDEWAARLAAHTALPGAAAVLSWTMWCFYWVAQGVVCTGIWVIAHECGHQAFSPSKAINNTVGWVLHTALLVPFHSWRITHSRHHKATNHLTRDQVFVPPTRDQVLERAPKLRERNDAPDYHKDYDSLLEETPLGNLLGIVFMLTLGWPSYLIYNVSGQKYPKWVSHFHPQAPFFELRDYWNIIISDIGVFGMLGLLGYATHALGFGTVVQYYVIPYLFVNMWLVLITFLQHTHPDLPHYSNESFTFLRGALATVDRDYGILNYFFHHIADSHVVHHLFSQMPHYNAIKATPIVRNLLEKTPHYHQDSTPVARALWEAWRDCKFVEPLDSPDVYWYNN